MDKSSLKYDILKEIFNIGVGKAADMLSQIVSKKILLDVPNVIIFNHQDEVAGFGKHFNKDMSGTLMVSSINFEEIITGEANLIFPADKMRRFINLCVMQDYEEVDDTLNFTDIDFDIVREVGNIILNSIIGEMGNFLDVNLEYTLPNVKLFNSTDFEMAIKNRPDIHLLMIYISFIIDDTEIEGAVIINLTLNSLNELMKMIKKMEDDLYE